MRAAVYKGGKQFAIEDMPDPAPGPGQVVVDVRYCAICGTDVHHFMYDIAPVGEVMGHEYSGVVSAVGDGVTRWKEGDRVIGGGGEPPPEAQARNPRRGDRFNYRHAEPLWDRKGSGGMRRRSCSAEWEPISIPDGVSDEEAAMCEPSAIAVHAVRLSQMKLGDSVVVLGAGPIGLFCMQVARAAGASKVIVSEPAPARAEAARKTGRVRGGQSARGGCRRESGGADRRARSGRGVRVRRG